MTWNYPLGETLWKKIKANNTDSDFLTFPKDTSNLLVTNKTLEPLYGEFGFLPRNQFYKLTTIADRALHGRTSHIPKQPPDSSIRTGGRAQNNPWQLGRVTPMLHSEMMRNKLVSGDKK